MKKLVVTRHKNLVKYLIELGLTTEDTKVLPHAKERDVEGKHVFGVLPYWLSSRAEKFTEVQVRIPRDKIHTELSIEDIRLYSCDPVTYIVKEIIDEQIKTS